MTPRALITTIGATALAFGAVIGGAATAPQAYAQETQTAQVEADAIAEFEAERAEAYEAFVAALAEELGSDEEAVDAAIREALKQQVAEQLEAGEISEEAAAARTAVIDVTDAPLGGHGFAGHGFGGRGSDGPGFGGPGGRGGDRDVLERPDAVQDDDGTGAETDAPQPVADEDEESAEETPEA